MGRAFEWKESGNESDRSGRALWRRFAENCVRWKVLSAVKAR
jgi:hypothetical protein